MQAGPYYHAALDPRVLLPSYDPTGNDIVIQRLNANLTRARSR